MNFIIIIIIILVYIHIFLHFKVNPYNELSNLKDVCKQEISNTTYFKLPFIFDGTSILQKINLNNYIKKEGADHYTKIYEPMPLIEPYVKFFPKNTIYELKKNKNMEVHRNMECRNFYIIHSGKVKITCIHPKYKEHFTNTTENTNEFIEKHDNMIQLELLENQILFLPNYWYVYIKSLKKNTIIEKVQYSTIMNQTNILWNKYMNTI
jgi:hypothetical protein